MSIQDNSRPQNVDHAVEEAVKTSVTDKVRSPAGNARKYACKLNDFY